MGRKVYSQGQNNIFLNKTWHLTSHLPKQINSSVQNIDIRLYPPLWYAFWPESGKMVDL